MSHVLDRLLKIFRLLFSLQFMKQTTPLSHSSNLLTGPLEVRSDPLCLLSAHNMFWVSIQVVSGLLLHIRQVVGANIPKGRCSLRCAPNLRLLDAPATSRRCSAIHPFHHSSLPSYLLSSYPSSYPVPN